MITHRYARANNKYMKDHDVDDISSFIVYLDANNLYGHAMIQKLPFGKFDWYDFEKINESNRSYDSYKINNAFNKINETKKTNKINESDKMYNAFYKINNLKDRKKMSHKRLGSDEKPDIPIKPKPMNPLHTLINNLDADGDDGYFVECDLHYPKELHDKHNSYPLAVEKKLINKAELSSYQLNQLETHQEKHNDKIKKLVPNFNDKEKYICHIKNLKYYIEKGLIVTQIHRILQFKQSDWLKPYIDFNTEQRTNSKNDFEKDFFKLMNNAVFGKTMENMRNRVDIRLFTNEEKALKQIAKPQYEDHKLYHKDLIAVKQLKAIVKLNKPIYVGLSVLDLSKLHMYQFHYDYILPKYQDKQQLLFTDTDSLCYHIQTEDLYKDMLDIIWMVIVVVIIQIKKS
jgi:hypothetical protein